MRSLYIALVLLLCASAATAAAPEKKNGFTALSGSELVDKVIEAKGKVVLINFFASWCGPCREEMPALARLRNEYSPDDLLIIGVSVDEDMEAMRAFVEEFTVNYPVFVAKPDAARYYGVSAIPHNVVYSRNGEVAANQPGLVAEEDLRAFIDSLVKQQP